MKNIYCFLKNSINLISKKEWSKDIGWTKLKEFIKTHQSNIVLACAIMLITVISFNLGRIAERKHANSVGILENGIAITKTKSALTGTNTQRTKSKKTAPIRTDFSVIASKKSTTKSYHFSWCPGASKIIAANKLSFADETAAITAGFHLASNCMR